MARQAGPLERLESSRSITEALRQARAREEQETLLGDDEQADDDGCYPPRRDDRPFVENPHAGLPVYMTIQRYEPYSLPSDKFTRYRDIE